MAIKASANISIAKVAEVTAVVNLYQAKTKGQAAPSGINDGSWTTTEPAFDATKVLYQITRTSYSFGNPTYSAVTISSAYDGITQTDNKIAGVEIKANDAAKTADAAQETAAAAQSTADTAQESADSANDIASKELVASAYAAVDEATGAISIYGKGADGEAVSQLDLTATGVTLSDRTEASAQMYSDPEIGGVFSSNQMVAETFRMGRFAWVSQSNGHLTLKDMGGA